MRVPSDASPSRCSLRQRERRSRRWRGAPVVPSSSGGAGGGTSQRATHGAANHDVLLTRGALQCFLSAFGCDAAERDRGACAPLGVLPLTKHALAIEDAVEPRHAAVTAQGAVRLEERHFLREVGLTDGFALHRGLESGK